MSRKSRVVSAQLIKYFLIITVALASLSLGRLLWNLSTEAHWIILGITGGIILISLILDIITIGDIIPVLKG